MGPKEAYAAIRQYEESIGRANTAARLPYELEAMDEGKLKRYYETAEKHRDWCRWGIEVNSCIAGSLLSSTTLMLMKRTPEVLQRCGVGDMPWLHTQRHLLNELHPKSPENTAWHGLSVRQLKMLPELMESPAVILDNPPWTKGIVCVLDETDEDGLPIILPFVPSGHGWYRNRDMPGNFVLSVYGRNDFNTYLAYAAEGDRILYIDKEKTGSLLAPAGLHLPETCQRLPDKEIIRRSIQIVNRVQESCLQVKPSNREAMNRLEYQAHEAVQASYALDGAVRFNDKDAPER